MAMFAMASIPLINKIAIPQTTQAWFADDAANGGKLSRLRSWWDELTIHGPRYGYFPNASKTFLLVKQHKLDQAKELFDRTGIQITVEGRPYLGRALGTEAFVTEILKAKVAGWTKEIERLTSFAHMHPHAAFASLTHGLIGRWTYTLRVSRLSSTEILQPMEDQLRQSLLPAITGQPPPDDATRNLLAMPNRLGGLGVVNPLMMSTSQFETSQKVC